MHEQPETIAGVRDFDCDDINALVTGSTSGIGQKAAVALGRLGATVFVHGRDQQAGTAIVDEIELTDGSGTFVDADFADVDAVRDLADTVRSQTDGLDLLINNAGGLFRDGQLTDRGVEYTFHINHLAPFLLTAELVEQLNPGARVVTTASAAHRGATLDLDRVTRIEDYSGIGAYSHSKLANILFASELARRLEATGRDITSNAVHPGAIPGSGFSRFLPRPIPKFVQLLDVVPGVTSVADGAAELLFAALSPRLDGVSGRYLSDQELGTASDAARDPDAGQQLWRYSTELLAIEDPLPVSTGHNES